MSNLLRQIRKLVPAPLLQIYRKAKRNRQHRINAKKPTEQVFSEIYAANKWGGEEGNYCSGSGTVDNTIADAYVAKIEELGVRFGFSDLTAVDLGCGDMRIGSRLLPFFKSYVGVDIVGPLIEQHRKEFGGETTEFYHRNIVEDELPAGDVCMVRQVFQHLSNEQIAGALQKLSKYRFVLVTEHLPSPGPDVRRNLNKAHGGGIRLAENSGVYLNDPPFSMPEDRTEVVLELEGHGLEAIADPGIIQTVLITQADNR